jgi:hypothetical protein
VKAEGISDTIRYSRVFELRVAADVKEQELEIPLVVFYRTKSRGGLMDITVPLAIER